MVVFSKDQCDNFIRVLALRTRDQLLLTCGTNAYRPICVWRRPDSLSTSIPNENFISGDGKSPYNSHSPIAYDLIDTGEFYSGTSNEPLLGVTDPLIQRSFTDGKQLRTQQHDSNWLRSERHFPSFRLAERSTFQIRISFESWTSVRTFTRSSEKSPLNISRVER